MKTKQGTYRDSEGDWHAYKGQTEATGSTEKEALANLKALIKRLKEVYQ